MTKPHKCPSCGSRALVLFTSADCSNRQCRHWDRVSVDTQAPSKRAPKCCGEDMAVFLIMGSTNGWRCWKCGKVMQ